MLNALCGRQGLPPLGMPALYNPHMYKIVGYRTTSQIVDSIMALFRTDFSGRGELSERQQKVGFSRADGDFFTDVRIYS